MFWSISVRAGVIHVNVDVATRPLRFWIPWKIRRVQSDGDLGCLTGGNSHIPLHETVLEPLHHSELYLSNRDIDRCRSVHLKIMRFESSKRAIEIVIGLHPCFDRRIRAA